MSERSDSDVFPSGLIFRGEMEILEVVFMVGG